MRRAMIDAMDYWLTEADIDGFRWGIPLIYSGQEAGLDKRLEFFEKDEIDWSEFSKEAFYENLITLKTDNSALWNGAEGGSIKFLKTGDEDKLLVYERVNDENKVLVVMNLSDELIVQYFEFDVQQEMVDWLDEERLLVDEGKVNIELHPWEYKVYIK